jgi:hypothetical protein
LPIIGLFQKMRNDGVDPNLVTYNMLIFDLACAGMVAKARDFLSMCTSP